MTRYTGENDIVYAKMGFALILFLYQHPKRQSLKSFGSNYSNVSKSSLLVQIFGETGVVKDRVVILAQRGLVSLL